jgi:hypothetical protein
MEEPVKRCWEEVRRLGAALATSLHSELAAELRELDRDFELCASPEEEAVHVFLNGLAATLEATTGNRLNRVHERGRRSRSALRDVPTVH